MAQTGLDFLKWKNKTDWRRLCYVVGLFGQFADGMQLTINLMHAVVDACSNDWNVVTSPARWLLIIGCCPMGRTLDNNANKQLIWMISQINKWWWGQSKCCPTDQTINCEWEWDWSFVSAMHCLSIHFKLTVHSKRINRCLRVVNWLLWARKSMQWPHCDPHLLFDFKWSPYRSLASSRIRAEIVVVAATILR